MVFISGMSIALAQQTPQTMPGVTKRTGPSPSITLRPRPIPAASTC